MLALLASNIYREIFSFLLIEVASRPRSSNFGYNPTRATAFHCLFVLPGSFAPLPFLLSTAIFLLADFPDSTFLYVLQETDLKLFTAAFTIE